MGQSLSNLVLKGLVIQLSILARRFHGSCLGRVIVEFMQMLRCTGASVCRCRDPFGCLSRRVSRGVSFFRNVIRYVNG